MAEVTDGGTGAPRPEGAGEESTQTLEQITLAILEQLGAAGALIRLCARCLCIDSVDASWRVAASLLTVACFVLASLGS